MGRDKRFISDIMTLINIQYDDKDMMEVKQE